MTDMGLVSSLLDSRTGTFPKIDINENHDEWPTRGLFTPKEMGAIVFVEELVA